MPYGFDLVNGIGMEAEYFTGSEQMFANGFNLERFFGRIDATPKGVAFFSSNLEYNTPSSVVVNWRKKSWFGRDILNC